MKLYAIGDIHLSYKFNLEALQDLLPHPEDGLILCGDVGETAEHLRTAFRIATIQFKHVFWVPGNHELYTLPSDEPGLRGEAKYKQCIMIANEFGVLTPEDPFMRWEGEGGPCLIAPIFTLYDYSFRPAHVSREDALDWAMEHNIQATDEALLHPDPYNTRDAWCKVLVERTEQKLKDAMEHGLDLIIINHWPLREDVITIPSIPRFSLWCGTKLTHEWHTKFNARVVVTGHLHVRRTDWIDNVRFEECSLGYPRQWQSARDKGLDINGLLREILPGPVSPGNGVTVFRRDG